MGVSKIGPSQKLSLINKIIFLIFNFLITPHSVFVGCIGNLNGGLMIRQTWFVSLAMHACFLFTPNNFFIQPYCFPEAQSKKCYGCIKNFEGKRPMPYC